MPYNEREYGFREYNAMNASWYAVLISAVATVVVTMATAYRRFKRIISDAATVIRLGGSAILHRLTGTAVVHKVEGDATVVRLTAGTVKDERLEGEEE